MNSLFVTLQSVSQPCALISGRQFHVSSVSSTSTFQSSSGGATGCDGGSSQCWRYSLQASSLLAVPEYPISCLPLSYIYREEGGQPPLQRRALRGAARAVALVRVDGQLVRPVRVVERCDQPRRVAEVHVLVQHAVQEQQRRPQVGGVREGARLAVALRVG